MNIYKEDFSIFFKNKLNEQIKIIIRTQKLNFFYFNKIIIYKFN
jgi:hypothetical protein